MKKKAKKQKIHYHVCKNHRWSCDIPNCNLSYHAHCGFKGTDKFSVFNFPICVKNEKFVPKLTFESIANQRVEGILTQKAFLNEACRLDLDANAAKAQLRQYRFKLRRLTKGKKRAKVNLS